MSLWALLMQCRFLSLLNQDFNDYVEISHKLYSKQTVDEIFDRAKLARTIGISPEGAVFIKNRVS